MTQSLWLACKDPAVMLDALKAQSGSLKMKVFCCACCRRLWDVISDERSRTALEKCEASIGGIVNVDQLDGAWEAADAAKRELARIHREQVENVKLALRNIWRRMSGDGYKVVQVTKMLSEDMVLSLGLSIIVGSSPRRPKRLEDVKKWLVKVGDDDGRVLTFLKQIAKTLGSGRKAVLKRVVAVERDAYSKTMAAAAVSRLIWGMRADNVGGVAKTVAKYCAEAASGSEERETQCAMLRDLFSDPCFGAISMPEVAL
jgi:hypothetical protein